MEERRRVELCAKESFRCLQNYVLCRNSFCFFLFLFLFLFSFSVFGVLKGYRLTVMIQYTHNQCDDQRAGTVQLIWFEPHTYSKQERRYVFSERNKLKGSSCTSM